MESNKNILSISGNRKVVSFDRIQYFGGAKSEPLGLGSFTLDQEIK